MCYQRCLLQHTKADDPKIQQDLRKLHKKAIDFTENGVITIHLRTVQPHHTTILTRRFFGHTDFIWSVVYGTDGQEIASASFDDTIRVWDVETGSQKMELASHTLRFSNIAFGRGGEVMAVGNLDGTIEVRVGNEWLWPFKAHAGPVTSVAFHPEWDPYIAHIGNGESVKVPVFTTLASAGTDGTVRFWRLHMQSKKVTPRTEPWVFYTKRLGSEETFTRVEHRVAPLIDTGDIVTSVAFSPAGSEFAFGTWEGVKLLSLWKPNAKPPPMITHYHTKTNSDIPASLLFKPVLSVAFSPDSRTLAAGRLDGTISLLDTTFKPGGAPPTVRKHLSGHKASVFKIVS